MDGDKKDQIVVFDNKKRFHLPKLGWPFNLIPKIPKKLLLIIVAAVVVISAAVFFGRYTFLSDSNQCSGTNNLKIMEDAGQNLVPENAKRLKKDVDAIQSLNHYDRDQNCMYPVAVYYLNISNVKEATKAVERLSKIYKSRKGFSKTLGYRTKSVDDLKKQLANLKTSQSQYEKDVQVPKPDWIQVR